MWKKTSYIIKDDNTLWGCGWNIRGQMGTGNTINQLTWVKVDDNVEEVFPGLSHTVFTKTDNTLWGMGENNYNQLVPGHTNDQHTPVQIFQ